MHESRENNKYMYYIAKNEHANENTKNDRCIPIAKHAEDLVSPQTRDLGLVGELLGPREADALNHARIIAQVERVVRFGRRRQQFGKRRAEDGARGTHQLVAHFRHVRLWSGADAQTDNNQGVEK